MRQTWAGVGTGRLRRSPLVLREPASPSGEAGLRVRALCSAGGRAPDTPPQPPRDRAPLPRASAFARPLPLPQLLSAQSRLV